MAFVGSVTYLAAGQVVVTLPLMADLSGNAPGSQCYYSHVQITPASSAVTVVTTFDSKPGVNYNTVGLSDSFALPAGARVMTVTPAGGSATAELGQSG